MTSALTLVSLPIFPLHTVLFPGGALPLRVFEPRYRMMVRGCREQGAPFGVVTLLSGSEVQRSHAPEERFYPLGTLAHIDMVATLSSGWELIHCAGQDRFRITTARQQRRATALQLDARPAQDDGRSILRSDTRG